MRQNAYESALSREISNIWDFRAAAGVSIGTYVGDIYIDEKAAEHADSRLIESYVYAQFAKLGLAIGTGLLRKIDEVVIAGDELFEGFGTQILDRVDGAKRIRIFYADERDAVKRIVSGIYNEDSSLQRLRRVANPTNILHALSHAITLDNDPERGISGDVGYSGGRTPLYDDMLLTETTATVMSDAILRTNNLHALSGRKSINKELKRKGKGIDHLQMLYNGCCGIINQRGLPHFVEGIRKVNGPEKFFEFYKGHPI